MVYPAAMERHSLDYTTTHTVFDAALTAPREWGIPAGSAALVVTSPPYPMIAMWDDSFSAQEPEIGAAIEDGRGPEAFAAMHRLLDGVWKAAAGLLMPGGIACVNVGDALRTVDGEFGLYPNAARIITAFSDLGFTVLPRIIWRKTTNAPNKFMGSGMLPGGAYVTLEHEHILIFRKGGKRRFTAPEERTLRRRSAYFWEERNRWFSDVWEIAGERQLLTGDGRRERSAAYPLELAYRLISMYSVQGDLVLDPFLGTGTTLTAALAAGRSSAGWELDPGLAAAAGEVGSSELEAGEKLNRRRLDSHLSFIGEYVLKRGEPKHRNDYYGFPVVTAQEREMILPATTGVEGRGGLLNARHGPYRPDNFELHG